MIRSPLELPFLIFYGFIGLWSYAGKPLWQAFLALYGITSLGIIALYFGVSLLQYLLAKIKACFKMKRGRENKPVAQKTGQNNRFTKWLNRQSVWIIFFFFILPIPYTDSIATIAVKLKNIKYGLWYLLLLHLLQTFFIVWAIYHGIEIIGVKMFS